MKIACVIHSLDGGGSERVIAGLASRLATRGHTVCLITLGDAGGDRHSVAPPVTRRSLAVLGESHGWWQRFKAFRHRCAAVREALMAEAPDVVLSFCDRTNVLVLAATEGFLGRGGYTVPVVVSERSDPSHQSLGALGDWLRGRLYPRAVCAVALTAAAATHLRRLGCPAVEVIPSAVSSPPVRSDRAEASEAKRVIGVGRLEPEKGFDRLIDAFADLADDFPDWSLRILGEGSQRRELESQSAARGVAARVSMPGWTEPQRVWAELADSTLFVLPSRYEGFPSALLEAMAVGVPCIAVDCDSGPRAIIRHGTDGVLVDNSTEGLAEGMRQLLQDAAAREALASRAGEVTDRFGWEAMVTAYERVLTQGGRGSQD